MALNPGMPNKVLLLKCLTDPNIKLVALTGKAGTGKTLLGSGSSP